MPMPVGYRFHPTDHEIINHYLTLKNQGAEHHVSNVKEIEVCNWEPWEIASNLGSENDDQKCYFFSRRVSMNEKSTRSSTATKDGNLKTIRYKRATKSGHWNPTGQPRYIKTGSNTVIGTKRTLVFLYRGSASKDVRTPWVMHEYCTFADQHNSQAFLLYMLKMKIDKSVEVPNSDGAELNASSPFASVLNSLPQHSSSTLSVHQGSDNFTSSDQSRLAQNWKEQEVSPHGHSYPVNLASIEDYYIDMGVFENVSPGQQPPWDGLENWKEQEVSPHGHSYPLNPGYMEDDDIDMQALGDFFSGKQPTWEELDIILPPIPLSNVNPNQELIHMTVGYLNVSSNEPGVTRIQNIKRREVVNSINSATSRFMRTNDSVTLDSESGTETDNDVPQSLFGDGAHGGSAYHSDSDQELYNDMILAHEISLSGNSDITQHVELKAGKNEYRNLMLKKLAFKNLEAVTDDSSVEAPYEGESNYPEVGKNKSSGALGKKRDNVGFIVYAENPRVSNGKTPPSSYITNIAIGIFLTVVITGEVLCSLVC